MARHRFDRLGFALRWGVPAVGLLFLAIALSGWRSGAPPTWTIFKPRATATVQSAVVELQPAAKASTRLQPVVDVRLGDDPAPRRLVGTVGPVVRGHPAETAWALADYPVGGTIRVRTLGGTVYADVTDWFSFVHSALMTVMAMVILAIGVLLNRALR